MCIGVDRKRHCPGHRHDRRVWDKDEGDSPGDCRLVRPPASNAVLCPGVNLPKIQVSYRPY